MPGVGLRLPPMHEALSSYPPHSTRRERWCTSAIPSLRKWDYEDQGHPWLRSEFEAASAETVSRKKTNSGSEIL